VLAPLLLALFVANYSVYGRRKLHTAALRSGLDVGRDQVARLMGALGIAGATRAKPRFTTRADPAAVRAPDLVKRHFSAEWPDALWVADYTYCSTWSGIVYVAFVIDVFSRRIVGWRAARTMAASLVVDALNMATWARRGVSLEGLICHSDAGSQYTSIAYTDRLGDIGAQPSIGSVADSYDKGLASHCTSWCWSGGNSSGEVASLALHETWIARSGSIEQPSVAVVSLVAREQPGPMPGLDGGRVDTEYLGHLSDGQLAGGAEPVVAARELVVAA